MQLFDESCIFYLHICKKIITFARNLETRKTMKTKWVELIGESTGSFGSKQYARRIPGNDEYAAVCSKPELSKKTKKKKAELSVVKDFQVLIATCKSILHDPARRAVWQARYDEAKRMARKHGKRIQGRLCDYVRHEVSKALKNGEEIA